MNSTAETTTELPRTLSLRDLVLFNVAAVLGLRWLATSAAAGPSALTLWLLAAVFFFVPQGLAVIELSARFPKEGGIYFWTKRAFGDGHGFLCGWCYWVNNILYYPNLLIGTAVIATYALGKGGLADSKVYVVSFTLTALWLAVFLNIVGLGTGKWLQNVGGIGTYVLGIVLIAFGVYGMMTRSPANPFTLHSLTPDFSNLGQLNLWASIAFAFAGLELAPSMGGETRDAGRNLPRAVFLSAPLIAFLYIVGTLSVLWLLPSGDVNIVSGFLQAISAGASAAGASLGWIVPLLAALYVVGNMGGVGAWLSGPARIACAIGLDCYFPPAFGKVHPRWKTPWVAILVQAILATVFLLLSVLGQGTTVEKAYLILLDTMLLVYFIPFIYLFTTYLRVLRADDHVGAGRRGWSTLVGTSGFLITLFAMVVACVPPSGTADPLLFELKVLGGAAAFVVVGGVVYWRGKRGH